jgi:hypothetical protein
VQPHGHRAARPIQTGHYFFGQLRALLSWWLVLHVP